MLLRGRGGHPILILSYNFTPYVFDANPSYTIHHQSPIIIHHHPSSSITHYPSSSSPITHHPSPITPHHHPLPLMIITHHPPSIIAIIHPFTFYPQCHAAHRLCPAGAFTVLLHTGSGAALCRTLCMLSHLHLIQKSIQLYISLSHLISAYSILRLQSILYLTAYHLTVKLVLNSPFV